MPLDWIHPRVRLTNNSGVHVKKVYEFGLMSLLMINARVPQLFSQQTRGEWKPVFSGSPRGKTLLVVGLGDMGGAMAKAGRALGMRVLGIRRTPKPHPHAEKVHAPKDDCTAYCPRPMWSLWPRPSRPIRSTSSVRRRFRS